MTAHTQIRPASLFHGFPNITASTTIEIEMLLGGSFLKGYRETRDDPGCGDSIEDVEVEAFGVCRMERDPRKPFVPGHWVTASLLDGVDVNSADIQKLFANIIEYIGHDEAQQLLLAETCE